MLKDGIGVFYFLLMLLRLPEILFLVLWWGTSLLHERVRVILTQRGMYLPRIRVRQSRSVWFTVCLMLSEFDLSYLPFLSCHVVA